MFSLSQAVCKKTKQRRKSASSWRFARPSWQTVAQEFQALLMMNCFSRFFKQKCQAAFLCLYHSVRVSMSHWVWILYWAFVTIQSIDHWNILQISYDNESATHWLQAPSVDAWRAVGFLARGLPSDVIFPLSQIGVLFLGLLGKLLSALTRFRSSVLLESAWLHWVHRQTVFTSSQLI